VASSRLWCGPLPAARVHATASATDTTHRAASRVCRIRGGPPLGPIAASSRPADLPAMLLRKASRSPTGFIEPCRPSKATRPPSGPQWVQEIKHDGFRLMVRLEGSRVRCFTRGATIARTTSPYRGGRQPYQSAIVRLRPGRSSPIKIYGRSSVRISASRVRSSASNDPLTPKAGSRHEDRHSGGFLPPIRHQLG
jgi:hypothetical protein